MLALMVAIVGISSANAQFRFGIKAEFTVPIVGLCFDASLLYSRMNNAISDDVEGAAKDVTDSDMTYGKNFLEIPINIKYKFQIPVVASIIKPYLFTGPSFAFKLDKSIMDKTFQAAWNVGVGLELFRHLQIAGSYGFGMNNVAKEVFNEANVETLKAKNNYWTISAAYLF